MYRLIFGISISFFGTVAGFIMMATWIYSERYLGFITLLLADAIGLLLIYSVQYKTKK